MIASKNRVPKRKKDIERKRRKPPKTALKSLMKSVSFFVHAFEAKISIYFYNPTKQNGIFFASTEKKWFYFLLF